MAEPKVIVFTCNWNAYNGLETAGVEGRSYSPSVYPLKVMCLGQISPGIILKAFENGADGVLLLGCPLDECHFEFGNRRAEEVFQEAKNLANLLGYRDQQLQLDWLAAGDGQGFVEKVERFLTGLKEEQAQP
jgi:coenzyme F420-reducing hydrogenase delta subunit